MKKSLLLTIVISIITLFNSFSQVNFEFGAGLTFPRTSYPGTVSARYTSGVNVKLKAAYLIKEKLNVGIQTGIYSFVHRSDKGSESKRMIPINISAEFFLSKRKFYPLIGLSFGGYHIAYNHTDGAINYTDRDFVVAVGPVLGVGYKLSNIVGINLKGTFLYFPDQRTKYDYYQTDVNVGITYKLK